MVVDTSALVAMIREEPGYEKVVDALFAHDVRLMSAASLVELGMVIEGRLLAEGARIVNRVIDEADIEIRPVDARAAGWAMDGWRRFGKGRHPAGLNLGDCFTYALAVETGEPILCVGNDFKQTDVAVVPLEGAQ